LLKEQLKILVGVDGSDNSMSALKEAIKVAKKFSGSVTVITVYTKETEHEIGRIEQNIQLLLKDSQVDYKFIPIFGSNPSRALVDYAEQEKLDLIVVGSRGLGKAAAFLLGSVSNDVVSKASCDVLVVK